ncbi:MAG: hypothetical protein ACTS22_10050 [Phycisphaerales bacterium]
MRTASIPRFRAAILLTGTLCALAAAGCVSSTRHAFLSLRQSAPAPSKSEGTTLAEAEMSNFGPTTPPAALATGH